MLHFIPKSLYLGGRDDLASHRALTARVRVLTERYGRTLPDLVTEVEALEARVAGHLAAMGILT